jgi:hypothetical protein
MGNIFASLHFEYLLGETAVHGIVGDFDSTVEPRSIVPATIVFPHVLFAILGPE